MSTNIGGASGAFDNNTKDFPTDIAIVGGCGHVGLPLGIAFADIGLNTVLFDTAKQNVDAVNSGEMPFKEDGAPEVLARTIGRTLTATSDPNSVSLAETVVVVIGTPVDEHNNPEPHTVPDAVSALLPSMRDGQLLILRSTVYPGVTDVIENRVAKSGKNIDVAFCPERIAEGKALIELHHLPQLISGSSKRACERAGKIFKKLTTEVVFLTNAEAELAKLFTNVWRYAQFAIANQLYMIANDNGVDYEKVRAALAFNYPRAESLPKAGFAAGPCLLKDAMQLATYDNNNFTLGHSSVAVNEGLPLYIVRRLKQQYELSQMTVGILGMAFKGESDDIRSSLSYKLKRILRFAAATVLTADPYVIIDDELISQEELLERADLIIIGAPHKRYAELKPTVPVADVWNILGNGVRI